MVKVVNPLFRNEESTDSAYDWTFNCRCICYNNDNHSSTSSGSWAPFTGGCKYSCDTRKKDNSSANQTKSHDDK